jgi:hypothetical protein
LEAAGFWQDALFNHAPCEATAVEHSSVDGANGLSGSFLKNGLNDPFIGECRTGYDGRCAATPKKSRVRAAQLFDHAPRVFYIRVAGDIDPFAGPAHRMDAHPLPRAASSSHADAMDEVAPFEATGDLTPLHGTSNSCTLGSLTGEASGF